MRQPSFYSRGQIIEAALELIREKGWAATTTRAIAKKLGSSTMPIYSHLRSRDELEKALRERAREVLSEHQRRSYTDQPLLNAGFGYVAFARDEKNLFRFLYLDAPDIATRGEGTAMTDAFVSEVGFDAFEGTVLADLSPESREALVEHTWLFTHGLAMIVNAGAMGPLSDERILELLMNAGKAFYLLGAFP